MRIIPAIDIIQGKSVRLSQGDYQKVSVYNTDPLDLAKSFVDSGIQYLHLVDLDGAKSNGIVNWRILEKIANKTPLQVDFGGGIKSQKDIEIALECGAKQITVGSMAYKDPELFLKWFSTYGKDTIILGADAKDRMIQTTGWLESSQKDVIDFIKDYQKQGVSTTIVTDISKDGMLKGPSLELYQEILQQTQVDLIASGGVTTLEDLEDLKQIGCFGAIIGKAIYEGKITLKQLESLC